MLRVYNTLSRQLEPFEPKTPGKVGMYVCGPTVYDYSHIGHGRVYVVYDAIVRYLRHRGLDVCYVRNITDIDDKIIKRAQEEKIEFRWCPLDELGSSGLEPAMLRDLVLEWAAGRRLGAWGSTY